MSEPTRPEAAARASASDAPRTPRELVAKGREFLARHGCAEPRLDAELLVAFALGLERLRLFLELDRPVEEAERTRARELLVRRARGEPVAYVTGRREFYGRSFRVDRRVLVPRPETELVVDLARDWAKDRLFPSGAPRALDVGTGSGCLAVTLALELEGSNVVATDVSADALELARENADRLGADVGFLEGDRLAPLAGLGGRPFDLVVSNPPYVDPAERADLPVEVREHEPEVALFAPAGDPDHFVLHLLEHAPAHMSPGGLLLVELGYDQWERLEPRGAAFPGTLGVRADLAGIPRILTYELPPA